MDPRSSSSWKDSLHRGTGILNTNLIRFLVFHKVFVPPSTLCRGQSHLFRCLNVHILFRFCIPLDVLLGYVEVEGCCILQGCRKAIRYPFLRFFNRGDFRCYVSCIRVAVLLCNKLTLLPRNLSRVFQLVYESGPKYSCTIRFL